jgi:hypothetical protein
MLAALTMATKTKVDIDITSEMLTAGLQVLVDSGVLHRGAGRELPTGADEVLVAARAPSSWRSARCRGRPRYSRARWPPIRSEGHGSTRTSSADRPRRQANRVTTALACTPAYERFVAMCHECGIEKKVVTKADI